MNTTFTVRKEVKSLTSFRFLAAAYVFLFHLDLRVSADGKASFGSFISEGAVGMTMFFVLSGFILMHAYQGVEFDLRSFFWNRVARVYPVYILAAVLALPWLAQNLAVEYSTQGAVFTVLIGVILLFSGLLLMQAWLPQTFPFWNNSASWSVSNEGFFYAAFPFLRDVLLGSPKRFLLVLLVFLSLTSSVVPVSALVFSNAPDSFSLFYALPIYRIPEFVCGMIAYSLYRTTVISQRLLFGLIFLVLCGVLHVFFLAETLPGYTMHNWIFIPAICSSLVLLTYLESTGRGLFVSSPFIWLGRISYCFYSFQFHVLEGVRWLFPVAEFGALFYSVLSTVVLICIAGAVHHLFEEPCRVFIRRSRSAHGTPGEHT